MSIADHLNVDLPDEAATLGLGAALASGVSPGDVLFLRGELGSGKTTLARGMLRGLGVTGRVKSPTYTLVELYSISRLNLYHFDLFRFRDRTEWLDSGFREYFNPDSICIVEWPERADGLLDTPDLDLRIDITPPGRRATIAPCSDRGRVWLAAASSYWSQR